MKKLIFVATLYILPVLTLAQNVPHTERLLPSSSRGNLYEQVHWMDGACLTFSLKDTVCLVGTGCAVDISKLDEPVVLPGIVTHAPASELLVAGNYVISGFDFDGYSVDVSVDGNYAYCANEEYGVRVIDVSDPSVPVEVTLITGMHSEHIFACEQMLQVIVDAPAFYHLLVDATDFENPVICSATYIATDAPNISAYHDLDANNGYLYLSRYHHGVKVYDVSDPQNPLLVNTISSPAWGSNEVYIDHPANLELVIFDAVGKKVGVSYEQFHYIGKHTLPLKELIHGPVKPGLYFCNLYADNKLKSSKSYIVQNRIY